MTVKSPPRNFSLIDLTEEEVEAKRLIRISRFSSGEPYFGKTGSNRFDDSSSPSGNRFGTCYFGFDLETAIAETVLHDETPIEGRFSIAADEILSRFLVTFHSGNVSLANLTGIPLKTLGGEGLSNIIPYSIPQQWARAVHSHPQNVDGIFYMSRHLNDRPAVVLFDRAESKLADCTTEKLIEAPGILDAVLALRIDFGY